MKKILFTALLAVVCMAASAKKEYCAVWAQAKMTSTKITMTLDDGSEKLKTVTDANGSTITFNSTIAALNYLAEQGWEVVTTYTEYNTLRYLLVREVEE